MLSLEDCRIVGVVDYEGAWQVWESLKMTVSDRSQIDGIEMFGGLELIWDLKAQSE